MTLIRSKYNYSPYILLIVNLYSSNNDSKATYNRTNTHSHTTIYALPKKDKPKRLMMTKSA